MNRFFSRPRVPIDATRWARVVTQLKLRRGLNYLFSLITIVALVSTGIVSGGLFQSMSAGNMDMLLNGGFEGGFINQPGCGTVGSGWNCFTTGGAANYGFYDEQWTPVIAEGLHGQLIEINSKGFGQPDQNRMAGIYQTVQVVDWANYTLNVRGMLRTSFTGGDRDPWGYRVEVGWSAGKKADWTAVTNWQDVGWYNYYERTAPGTMQSYSTQIMAEADYITIYIRALKKWGVPEEELDINLDAISLTGPALGYHTWQQPYYGGPDDSWKADGKWKAKDDWKYDKHDDYNPPTSVATCGGPELIYNGGFEAGFVPLAYGNVGKGWGNFTNGGAAGYGFYDEQWTPVVTDGAHGQLIEINAKGIGTPDPDRYAGIWQPIKGLVPGQTYQLTLRGELRGAGSDADPDRFVAQWGWNADGDNDWTHVTNWTAMNLGMIYDRLNPGAMGTYTVQFQAPAKSLVLFIRGWKKWGITDVEMDFNLDSISLRSCTGSAPPPSKTPSTPSKLCFYVVQAGDTLSIIANSFHVSLWDLAQVNGIANYDWIYVGQRLQIPGCNMAPPQEHHEPPPVKEPPAYHEPKPSPTGRKHVVSAGETLSYLCDLYGVDIWTIAQANGLTDLNFIYVGQVLVIP